MKKALLTLSVLFALAACGGEVASQAEPTATAVASAAGNNIPESYAQHYQVAQNAAGVVIFDKPEEMFEAFNDYPQESNQFEKQAGSPLKIRLSRDTIAASDSEVLKGETEMTLLYGILKTFAYTKENQVDVTSVSIDENGKFLQQYAMSLNVSREQVLQALKDLGLATSFDELVETQPNDQFRKPGLSGSKVYDDIVYKAENRERLIKALQS